MDGNVDVVVVSVVSLLSLLLLARKLVNKSAPSSSVRTRVKRLPTGQFSIVFFKFPLVTRGVIPVVHTLASLLPVLLSLPVLICRHLRSKIKIYDIHRFLKIK